MTVGRTCWTILCLEIGCNIRWFDLLRRRFGLHIELWFRNLRALPSFLCCIWYQFHLEHLSTHHFMPWIYFQSDILFQKSPYFQDSLKQQRNPRNGGRHYKSSLRAHEQIKEPKRGQTDDVAASGRNLSLVQVLSVDHQTPKATPWKTCLWQLPSNEMVASHHQILHIVFYFYAWACLVLCTLCSLSRPKTGISLSMYCLWVDAGAHRCRESLLCSCHGGDGCLSIPMNFLPVIVFRDLWCQKC